MGLGNLLRLMAQMLTAFPAEVAAALWRLILILVLLLLMLLRFFKEIGERVWGDKKPERPPENHCCEVPPNIKRKPDPCLYSQFYLMAHLEQPGYLDRWHGGRVTPAPPRDQVSGPRPDPRCVVRSRARDRGPMPLPTVELQLA